MQITINIHNADAEPSVHVEQHFDAPAPAPIPRIMQVFPEPMDNDARSHLWAAWHDAFGSTSDEDRHEFTRTVLGLSRDDNPTWSRTGSLTCDQTYYLARVLRTIANIL